MILGVGMRTDICSVQTCVHVYLCEVDAIAKGSPRADAGEVLVEACRKDRQDH